MGVGPSTSIQWVVVCMFEVLTTHLVVDLSRSDWGGDKLRANPCLLLILYPAPADTQASLLNPLLSDVHLQQASTL